MEQLLEFKDYQIIALQNKVFELTEQNKVYLKLIKNLEL